jgi:RHS repeat-associated protein
LSGVSGDRRNVWKSHGKDRPAGRSHVELWCYDAIYELTGVTQGTNTTESYAYDAVGNRLTSLAGSHSNNSSNEMTASPTASHTYDYNGNTLTSVTGSNTTTYAWDFENRLSSVTLPGSGGTVSFKYDPFGRRIYKSSSAGTSIYAYDGDNLIEEVNSSGTVIARYTQTQKIDEPLAMLRSGATSYYEADGLGSVTSLSNTAGALAQTYTFDSFGKLTNSSGSLTNPFQDTAREFDTETSLYFYRHRYYDQTIGRFLSEDLLRFDGLELNPNLYWYVRNNSTNVIDPLGLWPTPTEPILIPPCWSCIGFGLGSEDMWNNYERMKQRNWKGDDLYYHCYGNCQATNRGSGGAFAAKAISFVRTNIWGRSTEPDWGDDDKANKCGQQGGDCDKTCAPFVPKSSPGKPKFPGW